MWASTRHRGKLLSMVLCKARWSKPRSLHAPDSRLSMLYISPQKLLKLLRKILFDYPLVQRLLRRPLLLWEVLARLFTRRGPPPSDKGSLETSPPPVQTNHPESPGTFIADHPRCHSPTPADFTYPVASTGRVLGARHPYLSPQPNASISRDIATFAFDSDKLLKAHASSPAILLTPCDTDRSPSPSIILQPSVLTLTPSHSVISFGGGDRVSLCRSTISPDLYCIVTQDLVRYTRKVEIEKKESICVLQPMETDFSSDIPPEWTQLVHPDGAPFYYHEGKKILTDANLLDDGVLSHAHRVIDEIEDYIRSHNMLLPVDAELVLELWDEVDCGYYYVDHLKRCLFWLQECDVSYVLGEVKGATAKSHIKLEILVQYWQHWELFSNVRTVTHEILDEITDILITYTADVQSSKYSTAPHDLSELQNMMTLVEKSRRLVGTSVRGSPWLVGRLMSQISRHRYINFYGQYGARLTRDQSVHGQKENQRSYLVISLSLLLFCAPDVHLRSLEKMWVDEHAMSVPWKQLIDKLNTEWQEFTLYSTVLLNANVAFLAIPSVDAGQGTDYRSLAQIASYLSIVSSVASIILSLLLVRQNRTKERETAMEAAKFLKKRNHPALGLEALAILYSLPYALLMWGMVFFLAAFSLMCFQATSTLTRWVIGPAWTVNAILIAWCIWMNWESEEKHWWSMYPQLWEYIAARFKTSDEVPGEVPEKQESSWWSAFPVLSRTPSKSASTADSTNV